MPERKPPRKPPAGQPTRPAPTSAIPPAAGPLPKEGGRAPGAMPPLGSPVDLGLPSAAANAAESDTRTAPSPGSAPADLPAAPGAPAQEAASAATTASAPPVMAGETFPPAPSTATGGETVVPGSTPRAPVTGGEPATPLAAGRGQGQSTQVAATDAAAADRMRAIPTAEGPPATPPAGAAARVAALIRDQMDILALRVAYDTQELVRVGGEALDPVSIRAMLETLAAALERADVQTFAYTYSRAARPMIPQINDQVLPFQLGLQIGGMVEGILRDTVESQPDWDPALRAAGVQALEQMAAPAKRALLGEPRELVQWQAPRI